MPKTHNSKFKKDTPFEARKNESQRMRDKYPDRIPVIIERATCGDNDLPLIDKTKFLVPTDLTIGQLVHVVRKRIKLTPEKAVFLFVGGNTLPPTAALVSTMYDENHDEDGFLYFTYSGENVFGSY